MFYKVIFPNGNTIIASEANLFVDQDNKDIRYIQVITNKYSFEELKELTSMSITSITIEAYNEISPSDSSWVSQPAKIDIAEYNDFGSDVTIIPMEDNSYKLLFFAVSEAMYEIDEKYEGVNEVLMAITSLYETMII